MYNSIEDFDNIENVHIKEYANSSRPNNLRNTCDLAKLSPQISNNNSTRNSFRNSNRSRNMTSNHLTNSENKQTFQNKKMDQINIDCTTRKKRFQVEDNLN